MFLVNFSMKLLWLIAPLIIFNFIFSQDTLKTTDGKELSGKFISIVDKGVEFKIENRSRPILYPFESIVEITDSNGKLILNSTTLSLRAAKKERRRKIVAYACVGTAAAGTMLFYYALTYLGGPGQF